MKFEKWVSIKRIIFISNYLIDDCDIVVIDNFNADGVHFKFDKQLIPEEFKVASCRLLNGDDLIQLSKEELRLMRNEIFARYDYSFKSIDLQEYFKSASWYRARIDNAYIYVRY